MSQERFFLTSTDQARRLKNQLAQYLVTIGGVSALGALVLIFGYLAWVVIPLFSDASLTMKARTVSLPDTQQVTQFSVDNYGRHVFIADKSGLLSFWPTGGQKPVLTETLNYRPDDWFSSSTDNWFLALDNSGHTTLGKPEFIYKTADGQSRFMPEIKQIALSNTVKQQLSSGHIQRLSFSVQKETVSFLTVDHNKRVSLLKIARQSGEILEQHLLKTLVNVDELLLLPDGNRGYIRSGNDLYVLSAESSQQPLQVRDAVSLANSDTTNQSNVVSLSLLPGAYSLLVSYRDGHVSQWFDVLKDEKRQLTHIRDFTLGAGFQYLIPNAFSKGFFGFFENGTVQNFNTTSEKLVLFKRVFSKVPEITALSANEKHLVAIVDHQLRLVDVDMGHPEISFKALWNKVWYEGYSEPEYVWQSTSASDSFEAKFSIVPIAFGTIKAALFSMLFAVPIAVMAAIYTAYFMSSRMRRVVKPTIELMEALPTVIIGFLAGLWFAPIVERHLVSIVLMFGLLPLSTIVFGAFWALLPKHYRHFAKRGWHAVLLIPVLVIVIAWTLPLSFDIEGWLFGGDIRIFLADYGINFDQRNVLVVGLAMGFAVIPTIFTIAEDAIFSVPKHLSYGSLALGGTQWQTLTRVVLLTASPGIFSAIMMGLGRAVGETMIVLMATGNTPIMDWNVLEGMRTLAATIAVELPESEVGSSHFRLLFFAALLLFIFTFCVNSLAEWVRLRLREKYRAL